MNIIDLQDKDHYPGAGAPRIKVISHSIGQVRAIATDVLKKARVDGYESIAYLITAALCEKETDESKPE